MSAHRQVNAARRSSRPTRKAKLGQNFLIDTSEARRIVDALGQISDSVVVEIGPGRGVLTRLLVDRAGFVIATELDEQLARQLRAMFAEQENVEIVQANFLNVSLLELLKRHPQASGAQRVRVVGNIPYYITSDILLRLFQQHELIDTIVLMVQKEVADRVAAAPGSRDYGLLTVTAQLHTDVERLFTLPPGAFSPAPQVHSSVLRLRIAPKAGRLYVDVQAFLGFCKRAFAQKRKTLVNNLRGKYPAEMIWEAIRGSGVEANARAEALSLEELAEIYRRLSLVAQAPLG